MTEQPAPDSPATRGIGLQLALIAAVASIGLTAVAFWLSFEHLHDVAHAHGLADAARSWAWPATVDLFILIGEVLMLRGSLAGRIDPWSIALTAIGSTGSIALNVAGVGTDADGMDYVVAAVPPIAALLAFGALMRQIHGVLAGRMTAAEEATDEVPFTDNADDQDAPTPGPAPVLPVAKTAPVEPTPAPPVPAPTVAPPVAPVADKTPTTGGNDDRQNPPTTPAPAASKPARTVPSKAAKTPRPRASKKAPRRSMGDWVEVAGPIFHAEFARLRRQPTASEFATAIDTAGLGRVSDSTAKNIRTEILDRTDVPALDESP